MQDRTETVAENGTKQCLPPDSPTPTSERQVDVVNRQQWKELATTGLTVMVGMTLFEAAKQFTFPSINIWESHTLTIAVTTIASIWAYRSAARNIRAARAVTAIVESAFDAVIGLDSRGCVTIWNPRATAMFGWTREEVAGRSLAEFIVPPALRARHSEALGRFVMTRESPVINKVIEIPALHKDGREFPVELAVSLVPEGTSYGFSAFVRDITERKRLEQLVLDTREEAFAASRAKSEFLSTMSHEIRTPMNAILGMAELLSETELGSDQRHYLDVMSANGNALLALINSILDLARIESGRMQIEKTEFDLSDLIGQTISTFGVSAHGKGLELAARIAPGVPERLVGDPLRLGQVLVNLLGNAIKFTELGEVVLEVNLAGGGDPGLLVFAVIDTGIGIPPEKLDSIFASFTQVDSSTTRKYGGSGLGLTIAQRLVTMMGGRIALQSEFNKGSKFSFAVHFELAQRVIAPDKQVVLSLRGYRVLVVDDNQINRLILHEMMAGCGAEVREAESGEQALAAVIQACAAGKPFQIILLDMRMPGMDGLEVARRIRDDHLPVEPLILMLSSDDLRPQLERLRELALDAYLVKPITRKELFETIYRVLNESNRESSKPMPKRQPVRRAADASKNLPKTRLLVAEDSPDNRLLISAFLRGQPYAIEFAENGEIAVERFRAQSFPLVLMDLQMPKMDGLAATRLIRQWEAQHGGGHAMIFALTASVLDQDVRNAREAGCDLHLSKPIKKQTLLDALRDAELSSHEDNPIAASDPTSDGIDANGFAPATASDGALNPAYLKGL